MKLEIMSKQEYKIFKNNDGESVSRWFQECSEKRIVNLWGVRKRLYTSVEWDYYSLTKYLKFKNLDNCSHKKEIEELHLNYIKNNSIFKNKAIENYSNGIGIFYVKNKDATVVLNEMNKIFQNMLDSNCMNSIPIEDVEFPKEMLKAMGIKKP